MITAAVDSNVLLSGFLRESGAPGQVLVAWRQRRFEMITSQAIINEVRRNFGKDFFHQRMTKSEMDQDIELLRNNAVLSTPSVIVQGVATHPEDDLILSAALSAGADYLITGDRQLLALGEYGGVAIVSPRRFLDILNADRAL